MSLLELRMNYSAFVKLREFVKINDISAEIKDFEKKDDVINGTLEVNGTYLIEDLITSNSFSEDIPFNILFSNEDFEVNDIDCIDLDYNVVDGRGIEILFDILLKYEDFSLKSCSNDDSLDLDDECSEDLCCVNNISNESSVKNDNNEERVNQELDNAKEEIDDSIEIPVIVDDLHSYEKIKEIKEKEIDEMIEVNLGELEDNLPTQEVIEEKRSIIKVCYYKDNKDLDSVCIQNNIGIDKIFNDNKKTDFVRYRRVIIK